MSTSDVRDRLHALTAAIGVPRFPQRVGDDQEKAEGADAQRLATAQLDELVRRVSALTGVLRGGDAEGWDNVDELAARLLLADLAMIAASTRALNGLAATRLSDARANLAAAQVDADRILQEASGS